MFQGFLLLDSFFQPDELDPGKAAVNDLVDVLANKLFAAGKIKSKSDYLWYICTELESQVVRKSRQDEMVGAMG